VITLSGTSIALLGAVLAAWLVVAAVVTLRAMRRSAEAVHDASRAERAEALITASPALALIVTASGMVAGSPRLADRLGVESLPRHLVDFGPAAGLEPADAQTLISRTLEAQRHSVPFTLALTPRGSARRLRIEGRPAADGIAGPGGYVLWFFDATESEAEIARLEAERARLANALDALSALIEAAPLPMWHRGPDLRLSLVNTAYVRAVEGVDAADVVARGLELIEPTDGRNPIAAAAEARDGDVVAVRTSPATIAGERRMLRIVDVPIGAAGVAGYAVDVEELEQARANLDRFRRAQRDMLDRLSAGVAQFDADRGLAFFNQPFARMFGMRAEWLADHPEFDRVLDRMREAGRLPEARDFPAWKKERRGWFIATDAAEENWLLAGGLHLRVVAQPLPDGGLLLIFEDRTEQVQLASARDTLLRVRTATFDNLFEAIGVFAADGRLHLWNNRFREVWALDEKMLAGNPRVDRLVEAVGRRLANPAHAGLIRELVRGATVDRKQHSGRVALLDGRHFEFAAVPLPDGNALFTMLDITDSRRIEAALRDRNEALEQADQVKTAFVANMSYELRTPLTSISGFAEMLAAGYAGPLEPASLDYVSAILESVARLGSLIDDVLDLSQGEADALPLERHAVALDPLIRDAADAARPAIEAKKIELVFDVPEGLGTVTGDARRLRQVVDHLLRHAVATTPAEGRILLHAAPAGDEVLIVVSDNGEGMDEIERARVFDRFAGAGMPAGDGQIGLAMPLARQFVEAHGGRIAIASEPGQGSAISVHLPREA
jgi:signal transduction histidine kinase